MKIDSRDFDPDMPLPPFEREEPQMRDDTEVAKDFRAAAWSKNEYYEIDRFTRLERLLKIDSRDFDPDMPLPPFEREEPRFINFANGTVLSGSHLTTSDGRQYECRIIQLEFEEKEKIWLRRRYSGGEYGQRVGMNILSNPHDGRQKERRREAIARLLRSADPSDVMWSDEEWFKQLIEHCRMPKQMRDDTEVAKDFRAAAWSKNEYYEIDRFTRLERLQDLLEWMKVRVDEEMEKEGWVVELDEEAIP